MRKGSIAIITARGGSKRILGKNIKNFCGKPIIAYSICAALDSGIFDEVVVSTDSSEIAEIAVKYGASVPFMRSEETSGDFATTADVLIEVLDCYKKTGTTFSSLCCIYPTAPFVTSEKLRCGMKLLDKANGVIPVVRFSFPPQRAFLIRDNMLYWKYWEKRNLRSQDLEAEYHDCGQFYCLKADTFLKTRELVPENTAPMIVSEMEVQDIDTAEDWEMAELKYKKMISNAEHY